MLHKVAAQLVIEAALFYRDGLIQQRIQRAGLHYLCGGLYLCIVLKWNAVGSVKIF